MFLRTLALLAFSSAAFLGGASQKPGARMEPLHADVLVMGGTPSGVAAAVAAARRGERVVLVSNTPFLGGVLSTALMDQWDLNIARNGRSVERGIFAEMHRRLGDAFTPSSVERTFAAMVSAQPKIRLFTDASLAHVTVSGRSERRVDAAAFTEPNGASATIVPRSVVDATDDGDLAAAAGARYDLGRQDSGRDTRMQAATLLFTVRGVDWIALRRSYTRRRFGPGGTSASRAWGYIAVMAAYEPLSPRVMVRDLNMGREQDGTVTVNAVDVFGVDGRNARSIADATALARRETPALVEYLRSRLPGFAEVRLTGFAPALYVRETRHIWGLEVLRSADVWQGRIPPDAIGLASYPLDVHPVSSSDRPAFATVRHVYGIPFGSLVPRGFSNLLVASRAISATHAASASARIVPTTVEEGEAAGAASALAVAAHASFPAIASGGTGRLRADLAAHGVLLALPVGSGDGAAPGDAASLGKLRIVRSRETTVKPAD